MEKNRKSFNKMPNKSYLFMLLAAFVFSSCLKNSSYNTDFSTVGASVDLPLAAANNNGVVTFAFTAPIVSTQIPIIANLASPSPLGKATTVTLALDTSFLNSYNTNNGTSYTLLPDSVYTLSKGFNLTIPAGKRLDSTVLTVNFANFDLTQNYVLPITIQSSTEPIEQWNHLLISVTVKNKYDGVYTLTEKTVGWGAYSIADGVTNTWPSSVTFETSGPSSDLLNAGGYAQVAFTPTGGQASFGAATPSYTFDPNTDLLISVVNLTPDSRNRAFKLNPAVTDSRFDDATNNIYMAYIMSQNGRPDQQIYDTLIYVGPRP